MEWKVRSKAWRNDMLIRLQEERRAKKRMQGQRDWLIKQRCEQGVDDEDSKDRMWGLERPSRSRSRKRSSRGTSSSNGLVISKKRISSRFRSRGAQFKSQQSLNTNGTLIRKDLDDRNIAEIEEELHSSTEMLERARHTRNRGAAGRAKSMNPRLKPLNSSEQMETRVGKRCSSRYEQHTADGESSGHSKHASKSMSVSRKSLQRKFDQERKVYTNFNKIIDLLEQENQKLQDRDGEHVAKASEKDKQH